MSAPPLRVYVNEHPLTVPPGATVATALEAFDAEQGPRADGGATTVTDGRGIPVALDAPLSGGAILRVIRGGARSGGPATDALP